MKFVVRDVVRVTSRVVILRLAAEKPFSFMPGQFIQAVFERDGKKVRKAYSIVSSSDNNSVIELCIRIVEGGFASNYLANVKQGEALEAEGPFGHFILQNEINNDVIFLAAGAGIAALKPMIESALRKAISHDVWLFLGVRTEKDILYKEEFEALVASHKNFHFIPVLSQSESRDYERGYVQDAFKRMIKPKNQDVYICGFYSMVDDARAACRELGFPDEKVHFEKYV